MADRLRRFLHLERPRPAGPTPGREEDRPGPTADRFAGVERPHVGEIPDGARSTGAELGRFGREPERALELADTEGRHPFTRCVRCGMDNGPFLVECSGCGVSLGTPEQREYDDRFWAERRIEAQREAQAAAERRALQDQAAAEAARDRRAMAEAMAREVGRRERQRLDAEGGGWTLDGGDGTPLGLRLLRRLPSARAKWVASGVMAALELGLLVYGLSGGRRAGGSRGLSFLVGVVLLVVLAVPPGWWTRQRGRW